jgi:hypothetical protein
LLRYRDRQENLGHEHQVTDIQRFDKFYKNFNLMRSQYSDQHKIPPLNSDSFEVVNGQSWEDAYDKDVADDGGVGDKVFVNSHATGFITSDSGSEHSEQVIEAINVTHQASCLDWIKCCFTCGCYFCGFISPLRSFKQFFIFTTHRAMKTVIFSGKNASGKYGTMNAYTRTVSSWCDCTPPNNSTALVYLFCIKRLSYAGTTASRPRARGSSRMRRFVAAACAARAATSRSMQAWTS